MDMLQSDGNPFVLPNLCCVSSAFHMTRMGSADWVLAILSAKANQYN